MPSHQNVNRPALSTQAAPRWTTDVQFLDDPLPTGEALVEEDLLVEEVSIDGMCGVY